MIGSYNGVDFDIETITEFSMLPIRTPDDVDYLYTKFVVGFTAYINPKAMSYRLAGGVPDAEPDEFPVDTLNAIRHVLLQPRRPLMVAIFGDFVLRSPQEIPDQPGEFFEGDCLNGPTPLDFAVTRFDGGRTFIVRWKVETHLRECPVDTIRAGAMISNRFAQSDDVDSQWLTTRTTTGMATFRNDVLIRDGQVADDFRRSFAPLVPLDMQRMGMVFTVDLARNVIRYHVVDRDQTIVLGDTDPRKDHPTLPGRKRSGVVEANLVYQAATASGEGGIAMPTTIAQVTVTVKGSKLASLWQLCQYALTIASRKLPLGIGGANFIRHAAFVQDHKAMTVQFVCTMQITSNKELIAPLVLLDDSNLRRETLDVFGDHQGITPTPPNDVGSRGTMRAKLITAALTTACAEFFEHAKNLPVSSSSSAAEETGQDTGPPPVVVVNFGDVLPMARNLLSDDGASPDAGYTSYSIRIKYLKEKHILQAPTAGRRGAPTRYITAARPTSLMVVTGEAERVNGKPRLPNPEVNDPNLVLLKPHVGTMAMSTNPTADAKVWHVDFEYTYGMRSPLGAGDAVAMGVLPWNNLDFADHSLEPSDFVHGIIDRGDSGSVLASSSSGA